MLCLQGQRGKQHKWDYPISAALLNVDEQKQLFHETAEVLWICLCSGYIQMPTINPQGIYLETAGILYGVRITMYICLSVMKLTDGHSIRLTPVEQLYLWC